MRVRHERNALEFLDVENSQIRLPAMKPEQRVVIGAEAATAELACEAGVLRVGAKSFGFILTLKRDQP
jgi:hypothetical protein